MNLDSVNEMLEAGTPRPWKMDCHQLVSTSVDPLGLTGDGVVMDMPGINKPSAEDLKIIVTLRNIADELVAVAKAAFSYQEDAQAEWMDVQISLTALTAKLEAMK